MPKYLCLQRSFANTQPAGDKPSPEQMQQMYERFNSWRQKFQDQLVDIGGRAGAGRLVSPEISADGTPPIEVKDLIGGYMIVSADSLDKAVEIARQCPGLVRPGSGVEVIEIHTPE